MAIAFDVAASGTNASATTTLSFNSGNVSSASNRVGIVTLYGNNGGTPSSVTWNSSAMTLITTESINGWTAFHAYIIVGPASGVTSIAITFAADQNGITANSATYTGVNQSTTVDNYTSQDSGGSFVASLATSITPVANSCWVVEGHANDRGSTLSAGANTTERTEATGNGDTVIGLYDNNAAVNPAASTTLNVNNGSSGRCGAIIFSLAPVPDTAIKTINGLAKASVKTVNGLAIASVKTWNGLA